MLIDWCTVRIPIDQLNDTARERVSSIGDRIRCYCPRTGEIRYESYKWESIRSDSHQIAVKVGTDFWIQGSPARVIGDGDAVFSSGASARLDLLGCVQSMVGYIAGSFGVELPPAAQWKLTRVDVTGNLALESLAEVRAALLVLRGCEGGRYRTSQQAGDSVYWSHRSKHRSGKAYAKGPQMQYMMRQRGYDGYQYSDAEIAAAMCLLRLELKLGREWFARHDWRSLSPDDLAREWRDFFDRMIGEAEMVSDDDLLRRVIAVAQTEGRGRAAFGCWTMINNQGWERAREFYAKASWYRHLRILKDAGLGDADIAQGRIVPLRRKVLAAQLVQSWSQIAA